MRRLGKCLIELTGSPSIGDHLGVRAVGQQRERIDIHLDALTGVSGSQCGSRHDRGDRLSDGTHATLRKHRERRRPQVGDKRVDAGRRRDGEIAMREHRDDIGTGAGGLDIDGGDHAARLRAAQKFQVQAIVRRHVVDITAGTT